jgi:hypothetical protein
MRTSALPAAILWSITATSAFAACPKPAVHAEPRVGSLVVIDVDYCAPPSSVPVTRGAGDAPTAAPTPPTSGDKPEIDLYRQWKSLTSRSSAPSSTAAAVPGSGPRAEADAIGGAFTVLRSVLDPPTTQELKGVRIDERDRVSFKLTHFNFINFGAEFKIDKTVIESYVTLNKLWSQALGLGAPFAAASLNDAGPCPGEADFAQCVVDWMWAQILASRQLNVVTNRFKGQVSLEDSNIQTVKQDSVTLESLRAQLVQIQSDTLTRRPGSVQEIEWYNQVQASHDKLVAQVDAYVRLAEQTISGQTKNIDAQAAGTLVTVRITATNAAGGQLGTPVEVKYFVHSKYPVTFHAGYLYSSLKDIKFDQVRSIAGADLFQQVQKAENVSAYAAFLSYELIGGNIGRYKTGALATLGTDFKDPGARVYLGGSVRFLSRVYIGGGFVSASVSEGVNPVVEQLGTTLGTRDLFTAVTTRRDWKPYFQLSFGVLN